MRSALKRLAPARERRVHPRQRACVADLVERARGVAALIRTGSGTVFVYDDQRALVPPRTVRAHVWPDGRVETDTFRA